MVAEVCPSCRGAGQVQKNKNLEVKIPRGIGNGDRIRLPGEGGAGSHGGPAGDIYVVVDVKAHPIFQRHDNNLLLDVPVSFPSATLGDEIEVPTLSGRIKLKIPAGTQSGKQFRI